MHTAPKAPPGTHGCTPSATLCGTYLHIRVANLQLFNNPKVLRYFCNLHVAQLVSISNVRLTYTITKMSSCVS